MKFDHPSTLKLAVSGFRPSEHFVSWMHIMSSNVLPILTSSKAVYTGLLWILEIGFYVHLGHFKPRILLI